MASLGVEWGARYVLIGPTGQRAVFNDSTDADFVGILSPESSGLDSPEVREDAQDSTEADGGVHGNFYFGRRPVILQGTIIASSATDRNTKVGKIKRATNALRGDATLTWQPSGGPEVQLLLRRQQPVRFTKGFVKDFLLPMVSADAIIKSKSEKTVNLMSAQEKLSTVASGSSPWTNPNNVFASDNAYAKAFMEGSGVSPELRARKYGYVFPAGSKIIGVEGIIERKGIVGKDNLVKLSTTSGASAGTNKSTGTPFPGVDTVVTFGGPNDLWGLAGTLTKAAVEGEQFGLNYQGQAQVAGEGIGGPEVDQMKTRVYYADEATPNNEGDTESWPRFQLNGPAATLELKNLTTGKTLKLGGELGVITTSASVVTIDFAKRTIILGGSTNIYKVLTFPGSDWWPLVPGANNIEAVATGTSAFTVVTMFYKDAYL